MTATTKTETITTVTLLKGFDSTTIDLNALTNDIGTYYEVTGVGLYHQSRGRAQVGGTHRRCFNELDDARKYANGWFADLISKGYKRTA